jgi:hypothetical protein
MELNVGEFLLMEISSVNFIPIFSCLHVYVFCTFGVCTCRIQFILFDICKSEVLRSNEDVLIGYQNKAV